MFGFHNKITIQKHYYMNDKKLSIIIPCYNVAKYVGHCLDSIWLSGRSHEARFEVIAVNDGSSDETLNILNKYKNVAGGGKNC